MRQAAILNRLVAFVAGAVLFAVLSSAHAAEIWTGPKIFFSKNRLQDFTQASAQDRITPRVWLTRGNTRGLFNARQELNYVGGSPRDTEWAYGTTADLPNLRFQSWVNWHGRCSPCQVGKDAVVHLISEDIYIDIKILSWASGEGTFSYERSTPTAITTWTNAIEYYHGEFDHYFVTAAPEEAASLDASKATNGWIRTGQTYPVYTAPAGSLMPVCRFFSASFAPKSSHFYTSEPAECTQVRSNPSWQFESDAFYVLRPAGTDCSSGTSPLHRLYNNGQGGAPNHRYTTCSNIRDRMVSKGWVYEGIAMCVADASSDCITDFSYGTLPGVPTSIVATPGNANVTLTFKPPVSDGGLPIVSYTASCGSAGISRTATGPTSPITVRGMPNGILQACTVLATNVLGSGPASSFVLVTPAAPTNVSYNALFVPPLLRPTNEGGTATFDLTLAPSSKQFLPGAATSTYSYNGNEFWGPTLLMTKGETTRMRLLNALPEETTTHWHGLLLHGAADGGPHSIIAPGGTWLTDIFPVRNNAATYWYHPHLHEMTQKHLTLGAGGFIIVKDTEEAALTLPRNYGVDDIPLALTSRRFTTVNGVPNQLLYTATAYGDVMLVNGTINAQVTLPRQVVRLRILNSEIEREYNLGFNDGRTFYVIGNDGGLLTAPVPVTHLLMAPGERYEILVDLRNDTVGVSIDLESHMGADANLPGGVAGTEDATTGEFGSLLNRRTFTVLHINVGAAVFGGVTTIPTKLATNNGLAALTMASAAIQRNIGITGGGTDGPFTFNDLPFDMERIDQTVALNSTEAWTIGGGTVISHSFHIHGVQFRIVARNGNPDEVNPWEQGWKDTFYLPMDGSVTFVTRFEQTADARYPFMYHCHMINHEDQGLMGQFTVQ